MVVGIVCGLKSDVGPFLTGSGREAVAASFACPLRGLTLVRWASFALSYACLGSC